MVKGIFCILVVAACYSTTAQTLCDSLQLPVIRSITDTARLEKLLQASGSLVNTSCSRQVEQFSTKAYSIADSLGFVGGKIACYDLLGIINGFKGCLDEAYNFLNQAYLLNGDRQSEQTWWLYAHLGWVYRLKGNYQQSSAFLYKALEAGRSHQ